MTRRLAQDALRYVRRDYASPDAQRRKMEKRHGKKAWNIAAIEAHVIWTDHGHKECMAVLEDMIEARLSTCDKGDTE